MIDNDDYDDDDDDGDYILTSAHFPVKPSAWSQNLLQKKASTKQMGRKEARHHTCTAIVPECKMHTYYMNVSAPVLSR